MSMKILKLVVFMLAAVVVYTSTFAKDETKKIIFCDYRGSGKVYQIMSDNIGILYKNGFENLLIEFEENDIESIKKELYHYYTTIVQGPIAPEDVEFAQGFLGNLKSLLWLIQISEKIGFDTIGIGSKSYSYPENSYLEAAIINENVKDGKKILAVVGGYHCNDIIEHELTNFGGYSY